MCETKNILTQVWIALFNMTSAARVSKLMQVCVEEMILYRTRSCDIGSKLAMSSAKLLSYKYQPQKLNEFFIVLEIAK